MMPQGEPLDLSPSADWNKLIPETSHPDPVVRKAALQTKAVLQKHYAQQQAQDEAEIADPEAYLHQFTDKGSSKPASSSKSADSDAAAADAYLRQFAASGQASTSGLASLMQPASFADRWGDLPTSEGQQKFNNWADFVQKNPDDPTSVAILGALGAAGLGAGAGGLVLASRIPGAMPLAKFAARRVLPRVLEGAGLGGGMELYDLIKHALQ